MLQDALKDALKEIILGNTTQAITASTNNSPDCENGRLMIVILERGNVVMGFVHEGTEKTVIKNAGVIRRWGTSKGLGQLALEGEQENTIIDMCGEFYFPAGSEIGAITCDAEKWGDYENRR